MELSRFTLTPEQVALLPDEDDVAFYEQHGWYISRKILPDELLDSAILGSERVYRGERDYTLPVDTGYTYWTPEDGDMIRNNEFVSLQVNELRQLGLSPIVGAIAARLSRSSSIRLLDDQLVLKPANPGCKGANVGWHSDRAYWATCTSDKLLTAWIPLQDCDVNMGPLVMMDGSHKWQGLEDTRYFNFQNMEDMEKEFSAKGHEVVPVPMEMEKGQMSFHNCWTLHGSYPNYSDRQRLAIAVHLQDGSNQYRQYIDKNGKEVHMFDESLCRKLTDGSPDFTDPAIFPEVWCE